MKPTGKLVAHVATIAPLLVLAPASAFAQSASPPPPRSLHFVIPDLRAGLGAAFGPASGLRIDAALAIRFDASRDEHPMTSDEFRLVLRPEMLVSYLEVPEGGRWLGGAGVGIGVAWHCMSLYGATTFVAGAEPSEAAWGVRNAIRFDIFYGALGLELGEQYLRTARGQDLNEMQFMVTTNVLALAGGIAGAVAMLFMPNW